MAPDRFVGKRGEERSLTALKAREDRVDLTRLEFAQHPRPPQRELRQRDVFDSGGGLIGHVANVYVDYERTFRFVDVAMSGLIGVGRKHRLIPVEALAEGDPGSITLRVDRHTVEDAPTLDDPHAAPSAEQQRAAR